MQRRYKILTIVILGMIVLGFARGWFEVSSRRPVNGKKVDINLTIDTGKVEQDAERVAEKTKGITGQTAPLPTPTEGTQP